jgi:hypothetical protein
MSPSPDLATDSCDARPPQVCVLQADELLRLPDDAAALVAVVRGRVWLTRANDADDHFLDAGRTMRVGAGALALLSAEGGPAEVLVYREVAARASGGRALEGRQQQAREHEQAAEGLVQHAQLAR